MKNTTSSLTAILAVAAVSVLAACPANALSQKECSAKYAAAKSDGSLGNKNWNDFRKLECASTSEVPAAKDAAPAPKKAAAPAEAEAAKPVAKPTAPATATSATGAVFPKAISTAHAQESAGKSRLHTCLDQYKANKATNSNGGLKWIQKGGGYYSECNKQLKS